MSLVTRVVHETFDNGRIEMLQELLSDGSPVYSIRTTDSEDTAVIFECVSHTAALALVGALRQNTC